VVETAGLTRRAACLASATMSNRIVRLVLAALVAVTFSSCGALNSLNQTAGRVLDSVGRSVGAAR
jgi:hypothetical protein